MDKKLYALHISGSDSILAVTDLQQAESKNKELNDFFATMPKSGFHPVMTSTIIEWDGDLESHIEAVLDVDWSDIH